MQLFSKPLREKLAGIGERLTGAKSKLDKITASASALKAELAAVPGVPGTEAAPEVWPDGRNGGGGPTTNEKRTEAICPRCHLTWILESTNQSADADTIECANCDCKYAGPPSEFALRTIRFAPKKAASFSPTRRATGATSRAAALERGREAICRTANPRAVLSTADSLAAGRRMIALSGNPRVIFLGESVDAALARQAASKDQDSNEADFLVLADGGRGGVVGATKFSKLMTEAYNVATSPRS